MRLLRILLRLVDHSSPPEEQSHPRPKTQLRTEVTLSRRTEKKVPAKVAPPLAHERILRGKCYVIDGDTIVIAKQRIRLEGIDAPELDHPWGQASKWAAVRLCKGQEITARITGKLSYDRLVARCFLPDGRDIAAELVKDGLAIDWPKYSGGAYAHLEPEGIRKKLWRADARQNGKMKF
jgi:endonuclease YncB( thermonuclease family)